MNSVLLADWPFAYIEPVRRKRRFFDHSLSKPSLAEIALRALRRRRHLAMHLAARHAAHGEPWTVAEVHLAADLRREGIEDVVADERIVHRLAVVAAAKVRVAVVDLEVSNAERRVLHDAVEDRIVDRRLVDERVAVLDPRLLMVPRGGIARHREPNAWRDLRVQIEVGDGVVEAVADRDELIRIRRRCTSSGAAVLLC